MVREMKRIHEKILCNRNMGIASEFVRKRMLGIELAQE